MGAWEAMQGNAEGHGKGLTTFPDGDDALREQHAECLALEREGRVVRVQVGVGRDGRYVAWMPVEAAPPQPPQREAR